MSRDGLLAVRCQAINVTSALTAPAKSAVCRDYSRRAPAKLKMGSQQPPHVIVGRSSLSSDQIQTLVLVDTSVAQTKASKARPGAARLSYRARLCPLREASESDAENDAQSGSLDFISVVTHLTAKRGRPKRLVTSPLRDKKVSEAVSHRKSNHANLHISLCDHEVAGANELASRSENTAQTPRPVHR